MCLRQSQQVICRARSRLPPHYLAQSYLAQLSRLSLTAVPCLQCAACLLQAPKIKAGIGEINYRELMTHAIQSERAVLALRRAVPALRVLEARTAAIGRTAQALETKLLEFDDEPSVHAAARARYHTPVPAAVRAAVLHGPAPMAPVPWAAGYKIRRVQR